MTGRYQVQERFPGWRGAAGQARLAAARVVVIGVGALGSASANLLARAGVGFLRLVDPDRPSLENLHRQAIYSEADVIAERSKARAAADILSAANRAVRIEARPVLFGEGNAAELLAGADLAVDGLDNMASRHALNRACHQMGIPWVHASVAGARGQLMVIRPGGRPCLECWAPPGQPLKPGLGVEAQGVIGPTPAVMAGLQAAEALKLLLGAQDQVLEGLLTVELWPPRFKTLRAEFLARPDCPVCGAP